MVNVGSELRGKEWGSPIVHEVDASACKSILMRKGAGGLKHVEVKQLWVQEAVAKKSIRVCKIGREWNAAETLASYSTSKTIQAHLRMLNCELVDPTGATLRTS